MSRLASPWRLVATAGLDRLRREGAKNVYALPPTLGSIYPRGGSDMTRLATAAVFLFVVAFFVLPLYEFADIGEHWPHDGEYVSMVLTVLFLVGLTLILRKLTAAVSRGVVAFQAHAPGALDLETPHIIESTPSGRHPDSAYPPLPFRLNEAPRLLILQDFRI